MSEQPDFVDLVGKHLKYIYSQLDALSKTLSNVSDEVKDNSEGSTRANDELRGKMESVTTELARLASSFESKLAAETERLEKDLEVLMAAKDSEMKEFKTRIEAEVSSLREVALLRSEFEEFVKRFAQAAGDRLPPIPPPEEKPKEGQA